MYQKRTKSEVETILNFYQQKHTQKETCEKFGLTKYQLENLVKRYKVHNGRTVNELNKEKARSAAQKTLAERERLFAEKVEQRGFTYLGGFTSVNGFVKVQCKTCGEITEKSCCSFKNKKAICFTCRHEETLKRQSEVKKIKTIEVEKRKKELELRKAEREILKNLKFDEVHTCKVCGKQYTARQYMESCGLSLYSNVGYCSKTCKYLENRKKANKRRRTHPRENNSHYDRARKLGLPRDRGITLKKLIERDGLYCAICGMACIYPGDFRSDLYPSIDHIIPMIKGGGHTWDNVQVAHRICNSIKSDKIGEEYGNVKKENNEDQVSA